jgi:hypothetical protein
MNTNHDIIKNGTAGTTVAGRCVQSCKNWLAEMEQTKNKIANDFQETLESHAQLFHLALNEAEALAFQTDYPHLLFPTLAMEKIQAVSAWQTRQQLLRQRRTVLAEAV